MAALNLENVWQLMRNYNFTSGNKVAGEMICSLCNKLLINAHNAPCGCRFCFNCISQYLNGVSKCCPGHTEECRDERLNLNENIAVDQPMNKKISKLIVKCPEKLCQFKDELRKIENHVRMCNCRSLECPYSNIGCSESMSNDNISDHLLSDILTHTKLLMDFVGNLKNEMDILKANNNELSAENKLLRNEINELKSDGVKKQEEIFELRCKSEEINESEMEKFEKLILDGKKKQIEIGDLQRKCKDLALEVELLNEEMPALRNVNRNMSDGLDGLKLIVESNQVKMFVKNNFIDVAIFQRAIRACENNFQQQIEKLQLKCHQIENNEIVDIDSLKERQKLDYMEILKHNAEILLKMEINENKQNYGEFIWVVDKFSDKLADAKKGINRAISSESFFTHRNGYKMCLQVFPDGYNDGKGTHLSLFFCLIKGEYDGILQWPFRHSVTFEIINQQTRLAHVSRISKCESHTYNQAYVQPKGINKGKGFGKFISQYELMNFPDIMKNDQIYFKFISDIQEVKVC